MMGGKMEGYFAVIFSGVISLLFLGLGLPLANNKVPPNQWYGFRVSRYQYEDDEIWYAINEKGGKHFVFAGIAFLVYTAFCILFIGNTGAQTALSLIFLIPLFAFLGYEIYWSVREARAMAKEKGLLDNSRGE
jgi:drug/metabolite transporter (DMT)-like permease